MSECPGCKIKLLIISQKRGTFDFTCEKCGAILEPDAQVLIDLLPETRSQPKVFDDEAFPRT